jgi:hypothetical protein
MPSSAIQHQELNIGFYSLEARTSINSLCPSCSVCHRITIEFLVIDLSPPNKKTTKVDPPMDYSYLNL